MEYSDEAMVYEYLQDSAIGVFAGYNWQRSNLVYGGELNVTEGLVHGSTTEELGNIIELRGRVGYAMGDMLAYGFLGYGMSDWTTQGGARRWDVAGVTYGAGVDYMITTSIFAGLEFSHRELKGGPNGASWEQTSSIDVISLRISYNY